MRRTNIYLDQRQLDRLRGLAQRRGRPVAELVREAIDDWLDTHGVAAVPEDEWQRRFDDLLERRRERARTVRPEPETLASDVQAAVREVREGRAARRR